MIFWIKIGLAVAAFLAIFGAIHQHDKVQQEKGAAVIRAQVAEAKAAQETENARLARNAQAKAEKAAKVAVARWQVTRRTLAESELQRQAANEQLARKDAEYAAWRNLPLPRAVIDELRAALTLPSSDASRGGVSGRINVQAGSLATALTGNK